MKQAVTKKRTVATALKVTPFPDEQSKSSSSKLFKEGEKWLSGDLLLGKAKYWQSRLETTKELTKKRGLQSE